jgi:hypothetical protein
MTDVVFVADRQKLAFTRFEYYYYTIAIPGIKSDFERNHPDHIHYATSFTKSHVVEWYCHKSFATSRHQSWIACAVPPPKSSQPRTVFE